jgi:hypothetical protein
MAAYMYVALRKRCKADSRWTEPDREDGVDQRPPHPDRVEVIPCLDMRTLRPGSHLRTLGESVWSVSMAEGSELGVGVVDSGSVSTVWGWDGVDAENLDASHGRHCCHCETQGNSIGWHGVVLTRVGARPRSCRAACCVCFAEVAQAVNSASVDNTLKQTRQ